MESEILTAEISNIDLAAMLIAMDFRLMDASTVTPVSLDSITAKKDTFKMTSWKFAKKSTSGVSLESVKQKWRIPGKYTLDKVKLCRLLAHNHSCIRHIAAEPCSFHVMDLDGIGRIDRSAGNNVPLQSVRRPVGTCDTDAIALAITLGVRPVSCCCYNGRFYVAFLPGDGTTVSLVDVEVMLKDRSLRRDENDSVPSILVCMLDNRQVILDNIHNLRKRLRITADGGFTQALVPAEGLSQAQKEAVERHFD